MGAAVPQVITSDRASNNQFIDGSLKFDEDKKNYLKVTPGSNGNRRTWTWSGWVKRNTFGSSLMSRFFMGGTTSTSSGNAVIAFYQDRLFWQIHSSSERITTNRLFRDTGWYHIVVALDTTLSSDFGTSERVKIYVNGKREHSFSGSGYPSQNMDSGVNSTQGMLLGAGRDSSGNEPDGPFDGQISNVYLIDGVALGPGYFGFTDPLTGTWKPKKFKAEGTTVNDGTVWSDTCTFLRPTSGFDGNANTSNAAYLSSAGTGTITTAPFTIKDSLRIYNNARSDQGGKYTVTLNGIPVSFDGTGTSSTAYRWVDIDLSGFSLPLKVTNFQYTVPGSSGTGFDAVQVDGTLMLDNTTTNLSFGTNGFYLPLDGNSPIGEDKSGNGNDMTPFNFGGSVALDNPQVSGARPILNTTQGGTTAGVGVFGSKENKFYTVTTANGSVYQFDITSGDNPSLEFIRGATYRFDYTSHASHPLRFSSTNPDSSTTAYTTGTNTSVSNVITITVPHDAPDTLYYYCTAHASAMNGAISVTTDNTKADQYAANCVLAVPFVFRDMGDVSASINCTETNKTLSNAGGATDTGEESNFYNRSFVFDGSGDYVDATESNNCFDFGTGDFTIELWALLDNSNDLIGTACNSVFLGSGKSGWVIRRFDAGIKFNYQSSSSWIFENTFGSEESKDKWNHIAITREGSTIRCFSNGVQQGSDYTSSANIVSTEGYCRIGGGYGSTSLLVDGYIQDVRIYKGVAKYTSDFIVPATSPNILPDTPSGVSGGSKLAKITDGSLGNPALSGTRQFGNISVADSTDLEFGSGDFTLEAFIYYTGNPGTSNSTYTIFSKWNNQSAPSDKGFILRISDDGSGDNLQWFYTTDGSTNLYTTGSTLLNPNTWYHIAFVRNGTTGTFYVDGVADSTTVSFGSNSIRDTGNAFRIGANLDGGKIDQEFSGFISNVRVVKGDAVYTGNFTPPAAPLTSITNTKILACQDNDYNVVGITTTAATGASPIFTTTGDYGETYGDGNLNADSNASNLVLCLDFYANATDRMPSGRPSNQKSLSAGGDPDPGNTTTSHLYGKSAHFDGNDSYSISSSADFSFDGEFCVELWANATSPSGWGPFFVSGGTNGIWLGSTNSGLALRRYGVANDLLVQIPPFDEWVHLAFTRDGSNVLRLFINGEEQASSVVTNTYTQNTLYIGTDGAGAYYTGYIQDLRVYKGTAKYTSDFNPPFRSLNRVKAAVSPSQFRHNWYAGGPVSFSPFNTDINTVRGQETGYPTLNPLIIDASNHLSENNLKIATTSNFWEQATSTIGVKSGKWYWEVLFVGTNTLIGATTLPNIDGGYMGQFTGSYGRDQGGGYYVNGSNGSGFISWSSGSTIGVALDMDNGEISVYPNGIYESPFATNLDTSQVHYAGVSVYGNTSNTINFGQKPFKFPPPDGFQPLNAANTRPVKVISRPDQYVGVTTYVGTGNGTTYTDTSLKFKPDMTWFKRRDGTVNHVLYDSVRGYGNASNAIRPNTTGGESAFGDAVVTAKDNGFSVTGSNTTGINGSGEDIVCWAWKAGGNKNTFNVDDVGYASAAAAGLTGGTITPSGASVGTKQGFSIIKYTGTGTAGTISHGLLEQPKFVMIKDLKNANAWAVQHVGTTLGTGLLKLNATNKVDNTVASALWNSTAPTSSVFSVGTSGDVNYTTNSAEYITYLWHDVPGLQKFGSYESGGGTYDGPYIELGFKPAMVMVKAATRDFGSNWSIIDAERNKGNFSSSGSGTKILYWSTNGNEFTSGGAQLDILSNGFKVRNNSSDINDGGTYIYAAWAAAPTVDLYGGGANAR